MSDENETTAHYRRVREFMQRAGQETPGQVTEPSAETQELRARLLWEEFCELLWDGLGVSVTFEPYSETQPGVGLDQCDAEFHVSRRYSPVDTLDGVCDLNMIATGTLVAAGIADAEPQRLVDQNNIDKFGPGSWTREDGKVMKPEGHQPPDLSAELERQRNGAGESQ